MPSGSNALMAGAALVLGAIWYKMRNKKKSEDDEFVKIDDSNSLLSKLINPFNREPKDDKDKDKYNDDDFEKRI